MGYLKYVALAFAGLIALLLGAFAFNQIALKLAEPPPFTDGLPSTATLQAEDFAVVVTRDEDGVERRTEVWIAGTAGNTFIRSMDGTRWYANLRRDPALDLWIGGSAYRVLAQTVRDTDIADTAKRAFQSKYPKRSKMFRRFGVTSNNVVRLLPYPRILTEI